MCHFKFYRPFITILCRHLGIYIVEFVDRYLYCL